MGLPRGWNAQAQEHWLAGRKTEAVGATLSVLNTAVEGRVELALQAAYYLFLLGDYPIARRILEDVRPHSPDRLDLLLNLGVIQHRTRDYPAARVTLERVVELGGTDPATFDGLSAVCHMLGDDAAAREWGRRAIEEKTRIAGETAPPLKLGAARKKGAKLVVFSLWGDNPRYLRGALQNLLHSVELYPGFRCRFHIDDSVPADFASALEDNGAQVIREADASQRFRLMRRFLAADDPGVAVYLVRDCDSLINQREAGAVREWIDSGKPFHVMRDWWTHTDPMLAGMWGGLGGALPPLAPLIAEYQSKLMETPNIDQWFLRDRIWPSIRSAALVHDRFFATKDSRPFPGPEPSGNYHVGQDEFAVRRQQQAVELERFKSTVPSLRL